MENSTEVIEADKPAERLVYETNQLINSSHKVTVEEQRLVMVSIEKAQRYKEDLSKDAIAISVSVQDYAELCDCTLKTAYKALKMSADKLYERSIRITEKSHTREFRWLQEKAIYDSGRVKLTFSTEISKHIRQIACGDVSYRVEQATQLRSVPAIRLFKIFSSGIDPETKEGSWTVDVKDIIEKFELPSSYERWADLRAKVIIPAVNQINRNTSLRADWAVAEKEGRNISKVKFTFFESDQLQLSL